MLDKETHIVLETITAICQIYDCRIDHANSDVFNKQLSIIGGTDEQQMDCAETIDKALNG